jgi:phospholipid/cholesterol/gamma-HCH transport system permease protein
MDPKPFSRLLSVLGEFSLFMGETVRNGRYIMRRRGLFLRHCEFIGVSSIPVIGVAGLFMGSVLGYQLYVGFHRFGMESLIGGSVGVTLYRELAPVMAAVMVIGRSGASMAAELASMRVSEQIDALEVMAIDPVEYLVTPRVLAGLLMMPILAMLFSVVASYAAAWVACGVMGLDYQIYWTQYIKVVDAIEITHCVVKGAVFGLLLTWVACFYGFRAHGGARAVGLATRNTVVAGCLAVLFSDYILTSLLPFGFTYLRAN